MTAEFVDTDRTAYQKPGAPRPEREDFRAMLAMLATDTRQPPLGIAAWHADRLIRSGGDTEDLITVCAAGRHPVVTPRGGSYELWTATGRKRLRDDANTAAYEVDHLIERVNEKKQELAMEGGFPGGLRPFGWDFVPAEPGSDKKYAGLAVNEREGAALRSAAELVLSGSTLYAIAADWNRRGIANSRGGTWRGREVRRTLLRPWNAGLAVYQGRETGTPTRWVPPQDEDGEPGILDPILDLDVFRALQVKLCDPSRLPDGWVNGRVWPGSGVYLCGYPDGDGGYCDTPLTARHGTPARVSYVHAGHVARNAYALDEYVSELVCGYLERPEAAEQVRPPDPEKPDTGALHARIITLREHGKTLARMLVAGQIDEEQLAEGTAEARAEIGRLETQIAAAAAVSPLAGLTGRADIRARWKQMREDGDIGRMQAVIRHLMTVRVLPAGRGRPQGSFSGQFFRYDKIKINWRQPYMRDAADGSR